MQIIAIDLWDKRVWIATHEWSIAFPKEIVQRVELVKYLKQYFELHNDIGTILVGLPYDLYGTDTKQLDKTRSFMKKLSDIFPDKKIIGHDERFSSFEAQGWFDDHRDDIAAQCILQSYLDSKNL